jgi:hypothetical protein
MPRTRQVCEQILTNVLSRSTSRMFRPLVCLAVNSISGAASESLPNVDMLNPYKLPYNCMHDARWLHCMARYPLLATLPDIRDN